MCRGKRNILFQKSMQDERVFWGYKFLFISHDDDEVVLLSPDQSHFYNDGNSYADFLPFDLCAHQLQWYGLKRPKSIASSSAMQ